MDRPSVTPTPVRTKEAVPPETRLDFGVGRRRKVEGGEGRRKVGRRGKREGRRGKEKGGGRKEERGREEGRRGKEEGGRRKETEGGVLRRRSPGGRHGCATGVGRSGHLDTRSQSQEYSEGRTRR